jgi:hypothetical protein
LQTPGDWLSSTCSLCSQLREVALSNEDKGDIELENEGTKKRSSEIEL